MATGADSGRITLPSLIIHRSRFLNDSAGLLIELDRI